MDVTWDSREDRVVVFLVDDTADDAAADERDEADWAVGPTAPEGDGPWLGAKPEAADPNVLVSWAAPDGDGKGEGSGDVDQFPN